MPAPRLQARFPGSLERAITSIREYYANNKHWVDPLASMAMSFVSGLKSLRSPAIHDTEDPDMINVARAVEILRIA